jgi:hypothetical protein
MGEENKGYGKDELLAVEDAALRDISGVLESMETIVEYDTFAVIRGGKELFSFRVSGVDSETMEKYRNESTKMVKSKRLGGITIPTDFNAAKYHSLLIIAATHPEDKKYLWGNKELRDKAGVLTPWQLVDKVLRPGEKERVVELIEKLSGFDEENTIETIKNS